MRSRFLQWAVAGSAVAAALGVSACATELGPEAESRRLALEGGSAPPNEYERNIPQLSLRGTFNQWGEAPMTLGGDHQWAVEVNLLRSSVNELKFDVDGDWGHNFGGSDTEGRCVKNGANLMVWEPGRYRVGFNDETLACEVMKLQFESAFETVLVNGYRGGPMGLVGPGHWAAEVTIGGEDGLPHGLLFRAADGEGSLVTYGDAESDGVADEDAEALPISSLGTYLITFDERTRAYSVEKVPSPYGSDFRRVTLRGTMNGWDVTEMDLVDHGVWMAVVDFQDPADNRFKFDMSGDWSENYGAGGGESPAGELGQGRLVKGGEDIRVATPGQYLVTLFDQGLYALQKLSGWTTALRQAALRVVETPELGETRTPADLTLVGDSRWRGTVTFRHGAYPGVVFELAEGEGETPSSSYGATDGAAGETEGQLTAGGPAIAIGVPGTYDLYLDERSKTYFISSGTPDAEAAFRVVYLRGGTNNWGKTPMILVGDHLWETEVLVTEPDQASFTLVTGGDLGLWWEDVARGDSDGDGLAEVDGAEIPLPGMGQFNILYHDLSHAFTITPRDEVTYGKVTLALFSVRVGNDGLEQRPFEGASVCPGPSFRGVDCLRGFLTLDDAGRITLDLPAGLQRASFAASLSSHWVYGGGDLTFDVVAGEHRVVEQSLALQTPCLEASVRVPFGKALYVTGESDFLGSWTTAYKMRPENGHWTFSRHAPPGLAYKIVLADWVPGDSISTAGVRWERGSNRHLIDPEHSKGGAPTCDVVAPAFN